MNRLARAISILIGTLLIAAVLVNLANVAGRYLFDKPIFWAEEAMVFLQIGMVIIGAALVSRDNAHLRMDAAEHFMPARLKRSLDIAAGIITVVIALVVVWQSADIVIGMAHNDQRSVALEAPLAVPYFAFPLGFALIALFALLHVVRRMRE